MQKKSDKASSQSRELATRLFAKYDKNENDSITSKELAEILTDLNAPTSSEQAAIMVHSLQLIFRFMYFTVIVTKLWHRFSWPLRYLFIRSVHRP